MNQKQQNRQSRNKALNELLEKNAAFWQGLLPFSRAVTDLRTATEGLDEVHTRQQQSSVGITEDKEALQDAAIGKVLRLANNAAAYALDQQNNALYRRLNISRHTLRHLPDNEQEARLRDMLAALAEELAHLAPYNVTAAALDAAQTAVAAVAAILSSPRGAIGGRSAATGSIPVLEQAARHAITRMDKLVHNFEDAHPQFVGEYRQLRIVVDRGGRHEGGGAV